MASAVSSQSIARACGGQWLVEPAAGATVAGASIDTRTLTPGQVFFAIKGEHVDGHAYLPAAAEAGASVALVDDEPATRKAMAGMAAIATQPAMGVLLVPCVQAALAQIATVHRAALREAGCRVVAVTGSSGKTTTVRMIDAVLGPALRGTRPQKSFNNELGVPLTVLNTPTASRYLVCELGISHPGDMAPLTAVARPDIAVITSIGRAHIGPMGSIEAIAREKTQILRGAGVGIIPAGEPLIEAELEQLGDDQPKELIRVEPSSIEQAGDGVSFELDGARFAVPIAGEHNARNAALAVAVGRVFDQMYGLDDTAIAAGLGQFEPPPMRLATESIEIEPGQPPVTLINDAYNANPESVMAAINVLGKMARKNRRVAVLGDMLEMGDHGPRLHRELAPVIAAALDLRQDLVVLVGSLMAELMAELVAGFHQELRSSWPADRLVHFEGHDAVAGLIQPGDTVLLKASRGVRLERVAEALRGRGASG